MRYAAILLLAASAAQAQDIDIKGLKLGMSQAEVQAVMPDPLQFTIGGVRPRHEPTTTYVAGKLDLFQFDFPASNYEMVREAFRAKYPALACEQESVVTGLGAVLPNERCELGDLSIERYSGDNVDVGSVYWHHYVPAPTKRDL